MSGSVGFPAKIFSKGENPKPEGKQYSKNKNAR
jgi:hypothetical protein